MNRQLMRLQEKQEMVSRRGSCHVTGWRTGSFVAESARNVGKPYVGFPSTPKSTSLRPYNYQPRKCSCLYAKSYNTVGSTTPAVRSENRMSDYYDIDAILTDAQVIPPHPTPRQY